ncbi:hypothetical protein DMUE_2366 [Dictyocoela muelleri]|nr:hypothetical protein DMUE_2366 [Dictyocoela muelleri]
MLKTTSTYYLIQQTSHVHIPNYGKNESLFHRNEIKKRSLNTRESTRDVVDKILQNISPETIPYMSKNKFLNNLSSRMRKLHEITNLNDDIPEIIKKKQPKVKISTCSILVLTIKIEI